MPIEASGDSELKTLVPLEADVSDRVIRPPEMLLRLPGAIGP